MRNKLDIENVSKLVFMIEDEYLLHLGKHYEERIQQARKELEPVIRIINVNGTTTAIPLERACYLLDKYYKLSGKTQKKVEKVISIKPSAGQNDTQGVEEIPIEDQKQMA